MNVVGAHLERSNALVRQLDQLECVEHNQLPEVHLIVAQNGSVQYSLDVTCCDHFRSNVRDVIDRHNAPLRA
jgi:hypothetical protein